MEQLQEVEHTQLLKQKNYMVSRTTLWMLSAAFCKNLKIIP